MANNVSIATRPLVYSAFRYINNKVWTALAEYIDNSLQSFINHREELEKIIEEPVEEPVEELLEEDEFEDFDDIEDAPIEELKAMEGVED